MVLALLVGCGKEAPEPPLADTRRAYGRQIITVPLFGDADAPAAHADYVLDILKFALHLNAGEYQGAFLIDVF